MTRPTTTGKAQDLITFTRSTTGTYLDSVTYGNELVTNGTFDNNVDGWTVNADGTIAYSNGTAILTNTDGVYRVRANQAIVTEVGKTYVLTYSATGNYNFLHIGSEHFNIGIGQDGPHSKTFVAVSNNTNIQIGLSTTAVGASSAFDNISVKELTGGQGTQGTPLLRTSAIDEARIEYDASGNCLGLLVEEARTNLVTTSEALLVSLNRAIAESSISPTGEQTAQTWRVNGSSSNTPYMYQSPNIVNGTTYTCSVFVRLPTSGPTVEPRYIRISSQTRIETGETIFDLQEGTVVSSNMLSESITPVGNGWYRISVTNIATSSGASFSFILWPITDAAGSLYDISASDDGKALFETFGMQTETGSFPTSYIPTSGSTVTRARDVASLAVSEFGYNQDQGTVFINCLITEQPSQNKRVIDGNSNTKRWMYVNNPDNNYGLKYFDGTNNITLVSSGIPLNMKAAVAVTPTQVFGAANSSNVGSGAHSGTLLDISQFNFFANLNGHIKSIQYYPLRLSNAQLQALTL